MSWQPASYALLLLAVAVGFAWFERRRPPARVVALVAAMAALAVVGRLAFAALPNVKPTTDIVLFAGFALGPIPGFVVGAVTAIASNVVLGQGAWTAWQMVAWGGVGVGGGLFARALSGRVPSRWTLAAVCAVAGLAFGAFMDVYQWTFAAEQSVASYLAVAGSSLPFNLAHAAGNVAFCLAIGPAFLVALARYQRRFEVRWPVAARPGAAASALLLGLLVASAGATEAVAASPADKAARYLERAQNRDGGFGGDGRSSSSQLFTGWSALGLAAAGRNPRDVERRGGRPLTRYLRRGGLRDTGELERSILVLRAGGLSARSFAGRDLLGSLERRRRPDGSWGRNVSHTAFGVLALRAAGRSRSAVKRSAAWLTKSQNRDGGFGFVPSAASDVDDTGAVLQALAAAGLRGTTTTTRALRYLRGRQNRDGGFGQSEGRGSNAQSTAWAVQGIVAAGRDPRRMGPDPLRYLVGLQRSDGHIAYSRSSDQTPVWVTAQALTALRRRPFPIAAVAKRRRSSSARGDLAAGAAAPAMTGPPRARRAAPSKDSAPARPPASGAEQQGPPQLSSGGRALRSPAQRPERATEQSPLRTGPWLPAVGVAVLLTLGIWIAVRRRGGRWPRLRRGRGVVGESRGS